MRIIYFGLIFILSQNSWANTVPDKNTIPKKKTMKRYEYVDRNHTAKEVSAHLSIAYAGMVTGYILTQWNVVKNNGSFENYENNFGRVVMDKDHPIWNLVGHPYTGSQTYLFFRALGYERLHAFQMAFWTSTLFEFTIEVYTEPASIQDIYQTPVLGSALGFALEKISLFLLNNDDTTVGKFFGHALNPMTFFGFTEIETIVYPELTRGRTGLNLVVSY